MNATTSITRMLTHSPLIAVVLYVAVAAGLFATADQKEGMKAFIEKRPAKFEGR